MPLPHLRPVLARDGVFNLRDLGGLPAGEGRVVAPRRLLRGDALQRCRASAAVLVDYGVVRVIDLRDDSERERSGVFSAEGIDVAHHPILDPTFDWSDEAAEPSELLTRRYRVILESFTDRLVGAVTSVAEVVDPAAGGGAVAYHCAVGKDRTGLVTALVLGSIGVDDDVIVADYARSSAATAVQRSWLWSLGAPGGDVTDDELHHGVWSARPETMRATLGWIRDEYGGVPQYLASAGLAADHADALRHGLLTDA